MEYLIANDIAGQQQHQCAVPNYSESKHNICIDIPLTFVDAIGVSCILVEANI